MVNWQLKTDYLRCNPSFHELPQYDYAIMNTGQHPIFAKLVCMFTCTVASKPYPIALIQPYDAPIPGRHLKKDDDLGLIRIRARPRSASEFISLKSVVRGALLVEDMETSGDYFVVDAVDTDMFLRMHDSQFRL